jgi:hypothetical protein
MSKDKKTFDLQERLIDFAVRIIRIAESLPKTKEKKTFMIRNSLFDIRYSKHNDLSLSPKIKYIYFEIIDKPCASC